MTIKSILIHLDDSPDCATRLETAVWLSHAFDAKVSGLHVYRADQLNLGMPPTYNAQGMTNAADNLILENRHQLQTEKNTIEEQIQHFNARYQQDIHWQSVDGKLSECLAAHSCYHDLTIVSRNCAQEDLLDELFEAAANLAQKSPNAVLMLPEGFRSPVQIQEPLVAWNGSRESARAVHEALPLLRKAKLVDIIDGRDADNRDEQESIAEYLQLHSVSSIRLAPKRLSNDPSKNIIQYLEQGRNDLLVIGAPAHHRIRDIISGSSTRQVLKHSPVPVLLAS